MLVVTAATLLLGCEGVTDKVGGLGDLSAVTVGPDGTVWVTSTSSNASSIGRVLPSGRVTTFRDPGIRRPTDLTVGPDQNIWFTSSVGGSSGVGSIGRLGISGVTSFESGQVGSPQSLTTGPDGNLWFTNYSPASIGRITPTGTITTFPVPAGLQPGQITSGPDGNLWFTSGVSRIPRFPGGTRAVARITTAGVVTVFAPTGIGVPDDIESGPGGQLWFTNGVAGALARLTVDGTLSTVSDAHLGHGGIAPGPGGTLAFADDTTDAVGTVDAAGVVDVAGSGSPLVDPYDVATAPNGDLAVLSVDQTIGRVAAGGVTTTYGGSVNAPWGIANGADGNLWFTNSAVVDTGATSTYSIGRVAPDGVIVSFPIGLSRPLDITAGPDGNLWFTTEGSPRKIGRITTAGEVTLFSGAGIDSPFHISSGPDGNVWFTNTNHQTVGRITPAGAVSTLPEPNVRAEQRSGDRVGRQPLDHRAEPRLDPSHDHRRGVDRLRRARHHQPGAHHERAGRRPLVR